MSFAASPVKLVDIRMNGNGDNHEVRLAKMEEIMEALASSQKQLLTSQVLLTEQVDRTQQQLQTLGVRVDNTQEQLQTLGVRVDKTQEQLEKLGVRVDQVDGQIEALVKIVDGMIRDRGQQ